MSFARNFLSNPLGNPFGEQRPSRSERSRFRARYVIEIHDTDYVGGWAVVALARTRKTAEAKRKVIERKLGTSSLHYPVGTKLRVRETRTT